MFLSRRKNFWIIDQNLFVSTDLFQKYVASLISSFKNFWLLRKDAKTKSNYGKFSLLANSIPDTCRRFRTFSFYTSFIDDTIKKDFWIFSYKPQTETFLNFEKAIQEKLPSKYIKSNLISILEKRPSSKQILLPNEIWLNY